MIGLDYSVKPNIIFMGDYSFSQLISDATICGLGYISIPLDSNDSTELKIAFIFKDGIKGKKVIDRFWEWIKLSNRNMNAFGLDIIEKNDGSYVLCIYQDQDILLERLIPKEITDFINPIISVLVHYKCIDKRSENYYMFKRACKFSKCYIYGADISGNILSYDKVIIKENIKFYKEDEIGEDSFLYSFKQRDSSSFNKKHKCYLSSNIKRNDIDRINNIKYFFPITYNKIINCGYFKEILEVLEAKVNKSMIIQAICNVVLQYRISKENIDLDKSSTIGWIQYLANNYETPKSIFPKDNDYNVNDILEQIKKDEEYLKKTVKEDN